MTKIVSPLDAYNYAYDNGLNFPADWNITPHFTWNEVFTNEPKNNVPCLWIFQNALKVGTQLEKARVKIGKAFNIHRWYSSVQHNKDAGSTAKLSLHILGLAIDFDIVGLTADQGRKALLACGLPIRIENKTQGWNHADVGHPYIPNGYKWGLFNP